MPNTGKDRRKIHSGTYPNVQAYKLPYLIDAKFTPPYSVSAWVERKNLIDRINTGLRYKILLVSAPIGSGKTTLLSQWYQSMLPIRDIAWLSLDEHDNEPMHFFSYLAGSLRHRVEGIDTCLSSQSGHSIGISLDLITSVLLEGLNNLTHVLIIVLDDFQFINDADTLHAFSLLLQHSPPNIHWIISSRTHPSLNLSRLTLEDQLFVINSDDLRFDAENICRLGYRLGGVELCSDDAEYLSARTEGWVAGVKLAILSAGKQSPAGESLRQFTGSSDNVAEYLANTILSELPMETHLFLVKSSIVDTMNGDLCNALLHISNSQALLEHLEQAHLFIQPLDNHRNWYRYHSLFLDFLRSCLQRDFTDQLFHLHKAASQWFATQDMCVQALDHAFLAGDHHWCAELLEQYTREWMAEGEINEILKWVEKLGIKDALQYPALCVVYVISLIVAMRFNEAADIIQRMETRLEVADNDDQKMRAGVRVLNLMLTTLTGSTSSISGIESNDDAGDINDSFLQAVRMNVQAYYLLGKNQFDRSRRLAMGARDLLKRSNSIYTLGYSDTLICLTDQAQGNMKMAIQNCEDSFARVKDGRHNPCWVNAATILAHMRYEQNRLDEAEALCIEVLPLLSVASTIDNLVLAYVTLARVKSVKGNIDEAFQLLDYLHSLLGNGNYRRFLARVCYEKIRLCLLQKDITAARIIAADFSLPALAKSGEWRKQRAYEESWEWLGFSQASVLTAQGLYPEALSILKVLRESAHHAGYIYREIPLYAALAKCFWCTEKRMMSFTALNQGMALSRDTDFTRGIFDEIEGIEIIIVAAREAGKLNHPLPGEYFARFADIFTDDRTAAERMGLGPKPWLLDPLTDREIEMLKLLSCGLSNKEISECSEIALSTTKWHLKNIFSKLDVKTRTEAMVRAQELTLIDSPGKTIQ